MAEAILFQVAGEILMKLISQASTRLGMGREVEDDLTKLTSTISTIKDVLLDAEERQTKSHSLQNWLQKLEEALYDAEDVLDELSVKSVKDRLDAIAAEKNLFHLRENYEQRTQHGSFDQTTTGNETCSIPNQEEVIGRDDDKKKVKDLLLDMNMNVSFIVIAGMGGIDKTTLAKSLYHDEEVSKCFNSRIWVWVSDQFEVKVIVRKIIESVTGRNPDVEGMEALNRELQEVIGGKKYLLVIWMMYGRKLKRNDMRLQESNSWSLFRKVAFKEGKEPTSEEEWMSFKKNELLKVIQQTDKNDGLTPILNLSYNHLPPNLKQCFAYLSLFPKGTRLEIKDLIRQWMAHGFIESSNGTANSMEEVGKSYFKELCWRFFFWKSSDECNFDEEVHMHDVMREVATNVAGEKYVQVNSNRDLVVSERHISFCSKIKSWRDLLLNLQKAKRLRTFQLFLSYENRLEMNEAVLDELFSSFPRLRVLGLTFSKIHVVPNSIKKLRHLRYLNLSRNYMESLPNSITKLQNLQTLDLSHCYILKKLPRDTNNLVSLSHLDISFLPYTSEMEKLNFLQIPAYFVLDCRRCDMLSELKVPNNLNGKLIIRGSEQLRHTDQSEVSLINLRDVQGFRVLELEWKQSDRNDDEGEVRVMKYCSSSLGIPHMSLPIKCFNLMSLPEWIGTLTSFKELVIIQCPKLKSVPEGMQQLRSFKYLHIKGCPELEERFKHGVKDWPKIAHIPHIY
ncbi:LOW QUALITY PROTEIN: putative disease resistance protein RGA3 [Momordica charantia]|uniref:LOW QUALITY PROTEIN: putative disease resistance protein RGA3 n=1 Tax=Momordica charantia TaxID=3673 RepID=A0A6J1DNQ4_MOMCH|nr:LOW QUALITY PROTEIN: putative disease resistance protein RGA3 [Momordica charantia]